MPDPTKYTLHLEFVSEKEVKLYSQPEAMELVDKIIDCLDVKPAVILHTSLIPNELEDEDHERWERRNE